MDCQTCRSGPPRPRFLPSSRTGVPVAKNRMVSQITLTDAIWKQAKFRGLRGIIRRAEGREFVLTSGGAAKSIQDFSATSIGTPQTCPERRAGRASRGEQNCNFCSRWRGRCADFAICSRAENGSDKLMSLQRSPTKSSLIAQLPSRGFFNLDRSPMPSYLQSREWTCYGAVDDLAPFSRGCEKGQRLNNEINESCERKSAAGGSRLSFADYVRGAMLTQARNLGVRRS